MILPYQVLKRRFSELIEGSDESMINPASIDIRVGSNVILEDGTKYNISYFNSLNPYFIEPGEFILAETFETLIVPTDLAMELKLKSSRAREGYNHVLAFWFDPGWYGIGTMELKNYNQKKLLPLYPGLKIAQVIYHQLTEVCEKPYEGRYQKAKSVEQSKG